MTTSLPDFIITAGVLIGVFFLAYTAYRQQGLIDTVNEIKDAFSERVEALPLGGEIPYK